MKRKIMFIATFFVALVFGLNSCIEVAPTDDCSNEVGDIGPDYNCSVAVMPEICTVDGVDDHWVLDGTEYPCPNQDCTDIPEALVEAILAMEDCGTKQALDLEAVNAKISEKARIALDKLKLEATLCEN